MAHENVRLLLVFNNCFAQFLHELASLLSKFTFRFQPQVFLISSKRSFPLVYSQQDITGEEMTGGEVRLQLERSANSRAGLRNVIQIQVETRESEVATPGLIVELKSAEQSLFGFIVALLAPVDLTQGNDRYCAAGFKCRCFLKSCFCFFPLPRIHQRRAQE